MRGAQCRRLERTPTATLPHPDQGGRWTFAIPVPHSSSRLGIRPHADQLYLIAGRHDRVGGRGCSPSPSRSSWCAVRCWLVPRSLPQRPANAKTLIMRHSGGIRSRPWPGWCSAQPGRRSALAPARPTLPPAMTLPATPLATLPLRPASRSVRTAPAAGPAVPPLSAGGIRLPAPSVAGTAASAGRRPCRWLSHPAQSHHHTARLSVPAHPMRLHAAQSNPSILQSSAQLIRLRPYVVRSSLPAG